MKTDFISLKFSSNSFTESFVQRIRLPFGKLINDTGRQATSINSNFPFKSVSFFCMTILQTKLLQLISHQLDPLKNKIQLFHLEQFFQSKTNLAALKSLLRCFNS